MKRYLRWTVVAALIFTPIVVGGTACSAGNEESSTAFQETPPDPGFRQSIRTSERTRERLNELRGGAEGAEGAPAEGAAN